MAYLYFPPLPPDTLISFGGLTCVRPGHWQEYLDRLIQDRYPQFHENGGLRGIAAVNALNNGCILESVEKYLFNQFGTAIPKENLFKFYNQEGEGILPAQILEAISAVIEPMGFEIDCVLAPDEELRQGLGWPEKVFGVEKAAEFHQKAGICMINIEEGYSHAFYWEKMDQARFKKSQFRMAVILKPCTGSKTPSFSAREGLEAFSLLLKSYIVEGKELEGSIASEAAAIHQCLQEQNNPSGTGFLDTIENHLSKLLGLLEFARKNAVTGQSIGEEEMLIEAGGMIRRLLFDKADRITAAS
jgi:hypothetical protein